MKKRKMKKKRAKEIVDKGIKILCKYCKAKNTCKYRANKEKSEKMNITTYCTMTPNRPKSFLRKQKKK